MRTPKGHAIESVMTKTYNLKVNRSMFCQDPADSFSTEVGNIPHLQTQSKTLLQSVNGNNSTK